jgi:hypothetical protein
MVKIEKGEKLDSIEQLREEHKESTKKEKSKEPKSK